VRILDAQSVLSFSYGWGQSRLMQRGFDLNFYLLGGASPYLLHDVSDYIETRFGPVGQWTFNGISTFKLLEKIIGHHHIYCMMFQMI
jgi:hypothetical protein